MNPFSFFQSLFQRKLNLISLFTVHDNGIRFRCFWWSVVHSYFTMIIDQQNVGRFFDDKCSLTTVFILLHLEHLSFASFEHLVFLFFRLIYLSNLFLFVLILEFSVIYQPPNFFLNSGCSFCFFWKLRMLVTVNKPCHVPHTSRITISGTTFTQIFFGVSKK